jgi:hypothetical protein
MTMSAAKVIQDLLALGVQIKDAWTKSEKDWPTFLNSSEFKDVQSSSSAVIASLGRPSLQSAITAVQQKEINLLAGRSILDLSVDELTQFHALSDVEHQLVLKLLKAPDQRTFLAVLVEDVLPVLVKVGKIVVPLLL